jgi:hypothetical protein
MSSRVILFDEDGFATEASRVAAACSRLGLELETASESPAAPPDLAVGFLRAGERRIPRRIVRHLATTSSRAPLLLLTRERLVRPSVWLEGSLLVLLGDNPTEQQIASRLRMLDAPGVERQGASFAMREVRRSHFFAATFASSSRRAQPQMVERAEEWTTFLPLETQPPSEQTLADARSSLALPGGPAAPSFLSLQWSRGVWATSIAPTWGTLLLSSGRRAPELFRFPAASGRPARSTVRAASSDLMIALSAGAEHIAERSSFRDALRAGAGAVLGFVEEELRGQPEVHGAVVEVL